MSRFKQAGLYFVTSENFSCGRSTISLIKAAIEGGIQLIQLREKNLSARDFYNLAEKVRKLTDEANVLLIINDRVDVAMAVGADGVHLGREDFPIAAARRIAPDLIIGASTHSVEEIKQVQQEGASYLNIGPIFPTNTKNWNNNFIGVDGFRKMVAYVNIPFTVMGGIKQENIPLLYEAGARIFAVVTAITTADNPVQAVSDLLRLCRGEKQAVNLF